MKKSPPLESVRLCFILSFSLAALFTSITMAYSEDEGEIWETDWGPYGVSKIFSIARITEDDADGVTLRGLKLLYGVRDQSGSCNCGLGAWIAVESGNGQTVAGAGVEYIRLLLGTQRVPFAGRVNLGLENRKRNPHSVVGFLGLGFELGVWVGKSTQLAITLDRKFGLPAHTRNEVGVVFRFARPFADQNSHPDTKP